MGPVKAGQLQDVKKKNREQTMEERRGSFLTERASTGQNVKMYKQVRAPPAHLEERAYSKQVT